ncbi:hypothetical protein V5799_026516 [Amblyomma americanum]|uniref:Uncharacterized protein n=1 Tax=Amblyomma americanum TaxID=6943 RepID=A0AAQ4DIC3_AMBAM
MSSSHQHRHQEKTRTRSVAAAIPQFSMNVEVGAQALRGREGSRPSRERAGGHFKVQKGPARHNKRWTAPAGISRKPCHNNAHFDGIIRHQSTENSRRSSGSTAPSYGSKR